VFGVVSFAVFGCVIIGSWLAEKLLRRYQEAGVGLLLLLKAPLAIGLIVFSLVASEFGIIGIYLALYLLIGSGSVVENTFLNRIAPASHRASILSLFSLLLQLGGVAASIAGYFISTYWRFQNIWLLSGILLLTFTAVSALLRKRAAMPAEQVPKQTQDARQDA